MIAKFQFSQLVTVWANVAKYFSLFASILHCLIYSVAVLPLFGDLNPANK